MLIWKTLNVIFGFAIIIFWCPMADFSEDSGNEIKYGNHCLSFIIAVLLFHNGKIMIHAEYPRPFG